jgi:Trk K+ transport system NAD-binding subunit
VTVGDATDREVLMSAGLAEAPTVVLTMNDDAVNIYVAVFCHRLNPEIHVVSRITHERNLDAIHRAGADFVLSYVGLAVRSLVAHLLNREVVLLGEGADLFYAPVPPSLAGQTLATSNIGTATGLNVIAVQRDDGEVLPASANLDLTPDSYLIMIGTTQQRLLFTHCYGDASRARHRKPAPAPTLPAPPG